MTFELFRISLTESSSSASFNADYQRDTFLAEVIEERMLNELPSGDVWVTGDVLPLAKDGYYFKIGRMSKKTISRFENGRFLDIPQDDYPSTHVLCDINLQVLAICKNSEVAAKTESIAKQLEVMISKANANKERNIGVSISKIIDAQPFSEALQSAHAIREFWFSVKRPNHWDQNENVVKPLEEALQELDADDGETKVTGKSLDADKLEDVARSVSGSGGKASAKLIEEPGQKPVRRYLGDSQITVSVQSIKEDGDKYDFIGIIKNLFNQNRFGDE